MRPNPAYVFSTHALREEGDWWESIQQAVDNVFLPTPSARRATSGQPVSPPDAVISTHALREEGDPASRTELLSDEISTHALREEGDVVITTTAAKCLEFLPTPSARRATNETD